MNGTQWFVLGILLLLFGMFFMYMSLQAKGSCRALIGVLDEMSSIFCIRGEIFSPFAYVFFGLGTICFILCSLEPKKEH